MHRPFPRFAFGLLCALLLLCCWPSSLVQAQQGRAPVSRVGVGDSTLLAGLVQVSYGAVMPAGDLADRFGFFSDLGFRVEIKNRQNWLFGGAADFYFGNRLREGDVLAGLRGDNGFLIGTDGFQYLPQFYMRGWSMALTAGKVTGLLAANPNSGVVLSAGAGYLQHRIDIGFEEEYLPQLEGDYEKLYDRFTSGPYIQQYLGYLYNGSQRFVNFRAGVLFGQAFTKARRPFQADIGVPPQDTRVDLQIAFQVAWVLPIYENPKTRFFYD